MLVLKRLGRCRDPLNVWCNCLAPIETSSRSRKTSKRPSQGSYDWRVALAARLASYLYPEAYEGQIDASVHEAGRTVYRRNGAVPKKVRLD